MTERRVVLAIDGSEHSHRAFEFYCENLYHENDLLLVIHAFELPSMPAAPYPYGYAYYKEWDDLVRAADDEAKERLEKVGRQCQEKKYKFKLFKESGKAGEVICKFASDENADMIIMGSRGLGTVRRTFLGSVSDYTVHHAHIPVAVIPPPHEEECQQKTA
ncbi:uncharacterized protein LOC110251700 [Exaiptasia diaphana]|uniref:UspA domain-containing protein n=1 Tax=Exaiptasia diaphana TaxID=2652724 RepID=A0A913Y4P2_EXADI|nr:uncharacterized protein LOC110251700 [Exaiptasia diaphana]KXJ07051.1 Universal stress protein Sll1388 [Exaiptasia diaphana]